MKRVFFTFFAVAMTVACAVHAAPFSVTAARQVADNFFSSAASRLPSRDGESVIRLAYTAPEGRFFVFDRGAHGGFVIVSGDDRLPQVLGYGAEGDFSSPDLPPALQYWMEYMDRQIAFLQAHDDVPVHRPVPRATAVGPLLKSQWNQSTPYNNYCPSYGGGQRAVTGCVATATAQVMYYHQWPPVGRGSHSYVCNINNDYTEFVELSADFSQSVYRWDLMQDTYDENSSEEACDAVARLMSDVGISMDMTYGSNSGASEDDALMALKRYFGYSGKGYKLNRDIYGADEWDQLLIDEISKGRPILYGGKQDNRHPGHEFVVDGFDTEGYYHINWGWSGREDGFFLLTSLTPYSYNFNNYQHAILGLVPETQDDAVDDVLYLHGLLDTDKSVAPLGSTISLNPVVFAEGNMLDTVGYEMGEYDNILYYTQVPMTLSLYDRDGVERISKDFLVHYVFDTYEALSGEDVFIDLPESLEEGEYRFKVYSPLGSSGSHKNYMMDYSSGKELFVKMIVRNDTAYLSDGFLYHTYGVQSFDVPRGVRMGDTFDVGVNLSFTVPGLPADEQIDGPIGKVYLSLLKDGVEVATSSMCEVQVPSNTVKTYMMQLTAPSEPGLYELVLNDETGNRIVTHNGYLNGLTDFSAPVYILPHCRELVEDFETMTANNSTSDKNVEGRFTSWSFNKSGVRAPGEGKCYGANAVMMKKPSTVYTTRPISHNFIWAQATFFNPTATASKYRLEYSLDGGATWQAARTLDNLDAVDVPERSQILGSWYLDLTTAQPADFRISMVAGGTGATYVDDIALYYLDQAGDVNGDGEISIADVNAVVGMILGNPGDATGDVNGDGEVNIADVNAIIDMILGGD